IQRQQARGTAAQTGQRADRRTQQSPQWKRREGLMAATSAPSPNEVARERMGRNYLSFSAISAYQACPLQFFFRYVEQLPEDTISASLTFGSAIHACLQLHFQELLAGNSPPDLDTLLGVYQNAWQQEGKSIVRFARGEDINT